MARPHQHHPIRRRVARPGDLPAQHQTGHVQPERGSEIVDIDVEGELLTLMPLAVRCLWLPKNRILVPI